MPALSDRYPTTCIDVFVHVVVGVVLVCGCCCSFVSSNRISSFSQAHTTAVASAAPAQPEPLAPGQFDMVPFEMVRDNIEQAMRARILELKGKV